MKHYDHWHTLLRCLWSNKSTAQLIPTPHTLPAISLRVINIIIETPLKHGGVGGSRRTHNHSDTWLPILGNKNFRVFNASIVRKVFA